MKKFIAALLISCAPLFADYGKRVCSTSVDDGTVSCEISMFEYNAKTLQKEVNMVTMGWYENKGGNTNHEKANLTGEFMAQHRHHEFDASLDYYYGKYGNVLGEDYLSNRYGYTYLRFFNYRTDLFFYTHFERDRMLKVDFRNNTGGGVKYNIARNNFFGLNVSSALAYQLEDKESTKHDARLSNRVRAGLKLGRFKLISQAFYIPSVFNPSHYRLKYDTYLDIGFGYLSLTRKHNKNRTAHAKANLRLGYEIKYNSDSSPGTTDTDRKIYAKVGFKMGINRRY